MATITIDANPALVTATDTGENVVVFGSDFNDVMSSPVTAMIEIVTGTFSFNSMGNTAATGASYTTAGTKVLVTFKNSSGISFKATTINDAFKISI